MIDAIKIIKDELARIDEARAKATPHQCETQGNIYIYAKDIMVADNNDDEAIARARGVGGGMSVEQQRNNIRFIALAANEITNLTKALSVAVSALEKYSDSGMQNLAGASLTTMANILSGKDGE